MLFVHVIKSLRYLQLKCGSMAVYTTAYEMICTVISKLKYYVIYVCLVEKGMIHTSIF